MQSSIPDSVLDAFACAGASIETLTGGRTNDTWRIDGAKDLVIQRLRADTGMDLLAVMENLVRVTSHLEWSHHTGPDRDLPTWWPVLVPTTAGRPFLIDDHGAVWRAFVYRPGRIPRGPLPSSSIVSAARVFARFSAGVSDLGGDPLIVSTPGFHDLESVRDDFDRLVADAGVRNDARLAGVQPHLDLVDDLHRRIGDLVAADGLGSVPHRAVHNDTKLSNALLAPDGDQAVAVLDLDLAMMGPIWHDVGDLLRSAAWHHDGAGFATPVFDAATTEAVLRVYAETCGDAVTDAELATFATAGPRLALELGVRYLSDHLRDVPVLRVAGEDGHLRRGLANMNLAEEMLAAYHALRSVVDQMIATRAR